MLNVHTFMEFPDILKVSQTRYIEQKRERAPHLNRDELNTRHSSSNIPSDILPTAELKNDVEPTST